jgi:hypothetical protein
VVALSQGDVPGVIQNMDLIHNHTRRRLPKRAAASSSFGFPGATGILVTSPAIGGIEIESSGSAPSGPSLRLMSCPLCCTGLWSLGPGLGVLTVPILDTHLFHRCLPYRVYPHACCSPYRAPGHAACRTPKPISSDRPRVLRHATPIRTFFLPLPWKETEARDRGRHHHQISTEVHYYYLYYELLL